MSLLRRLWEYLFSPVSERAADDRTPGHDVASPPGLPVAVESVEQADAADDPGIWWLPRPPTPSTEPAPPDSPVMYESLRARLGAVVDDPNPDLPRLPHVTDRALLMLRGDGADYRELARLISEDPALTARVLRVANSAWYGGVSEIRSLEAAFARLGQRKLRGVILSASLQSLSIRLGGTKRTLGEGIWRRAMASGVIMSLAAPRCDADGDQAFLIGLLHDIGLFVVLMVTHKYSELTGAKVPRAVFDRLAGEWHEHAGLRLAGSWNLPDPLPELIASHHRMPAADDPLRTERLLILFTDVCCSLLGYAPYHPYDFFQTPCVQQLGFQDTPEIRRFLRSFPRQIAERIEAL